jgi:rare lipoprotein A
MGAERTSRPGLRAWASRSHGTGALLLLWLTACSLPPSKVRPPTIASDRVTQTGIASWYGPGFHGKATASGAIYNQNELTAAHPTLPLGTRVMVTNLQNGSSTEVIINDRGPYAKGRIIDLSYAAGQILGMIGPGTIPVRLEVIDGPYKVQSVRSSLDYTLQIGSFARLENAQQLRDRLVQSFPDVTIVSLQINDDTFYRVRLGTFSDRTAAIERGRQLSREGYTVIVMEK